MCHAALNCYSLLIVNDLPVILYFHTKIYSILYKYPKVFYFLQTARSH
jgi:hypothetical protein